jgi:hypothetical protein
MTGSARFCPTPRARPAGVWSACRPSARWARSASGELLPSQLASFQSSDEFAQRGRPPDEAATARALGDYGPLAAEAVGDLIALMGSDAAHVAAEALGEIRAGPERVVPVLCDRVKAGLEGRRGLVASAALGALARFGANGSGCSRTLIRAANDFDGVLMLEAVAALCQVNPASPELPGAVARVFAQGGNQATLAIVVIRDMHLVRYPAGLAAVLRRAALSPVTEAAQLAQELCRRGENDLQGPCD